MGKKKSKVKQNKMNWQTLYKSFSNEGIEEKNPIQFSLLRFKQMLVVFQVSIFHVETEAVLWDCQLNVGEW